jgi:hypothetical protein
MEDMDVFLHADEAPYGDVEMLRAQLKESDVSISKIYKQRHET